MFIESKLKILHKYENFVLFYMNVYFVDFDFKYLTVYSLESQLYLRNQLIKNDILEEGNVNVL